MNCYKTGRGGFSRIFLKTWFFGSWIVFSLRDTRFCSGWLSPNLNYSTNQSVTKKNFTKLPRRMASSQHSRHIPRISVSLQMNSSGSRSSSPDSARLTSPSSPPSWTWRPRPTGSRGPQEAGREAPRTSGTSGPSIRPPPSPLRNTDLPGLTRCITWCQRYSARSR